MNIEQIKARAVEVIGSEEAAEEWLSSPAIGLENRRPDDVMATSEGVQRVAEYLVQIEYGVYA
ncbi:MbcA/ParS/Xre antitoxin family protein [Sulfitobacter sp. R18_1]|uniref:MbcA/ParS/Xre antitoxin family protein n=1 Tax=Sulfitobacter sp. R18_1 TaxID=2821104 RepID=UPI001AD97B49|nr:MbcA/ParS/Xre antitoxin family protein [Sulfitobacter sp. R18_1]MBO9428746.1 DUF2384 domain-containing protein [Sulfitobacter sp. R18_1]